MKVIINADDLGYSQGTNDIIFALMDHRRITSTTILANSPAFADAVKRMPDYAGFSFGVHLNLTEFQPLTRPQVFSDTGMVDGKGGFSGSLRKVTPSATLKEAILREWEEQVTKVLDSGVRISHFDSHHHTHTLAWLFTTLKKLQKKFGMRKVRGTYNWYYGEMRQPSSGLLLRKTAWNWALRNYYKTRTTDYFTNFNRFSENLGAGTAHAGIWELMCHPGQPYFPGQRYVENERELLWSEWVQKSPVTIELISYNQL